MKQKEFQQKQEANLVDQDFYETFEKEHSKDVMDYFDSQVTFHLND
jgi:hypothetical protein